MEIARFVCPTKFLYTRRRLTTQDPWILDLGCGNHSPSLTKHWFPQCHYSGADIQHYNLDENDLAAMDNFFLLQTDGSGYSAIPDDSFDLIIVHHVIEHMSDPLPILASLCSKLKPGGHIWIAFPSVRSLAMPRAAAGTLQFCDDDTHIRVPSLQDTSNVLLKNGLKVLHAGRTWDTVRTLVGLLVLPWALLQWAFTGKLRAYGLWYLLGFEDHVLARRKPL